MNITKGLEYQSSIITSEQVNPVQMERVHAHLHDFQRPNTGQAFLLYFIKQLYLHNDDTYIPEKHSACESCFACTVLPHVNDDILIRS
jgi:hypothetical protein